MRTARASGRGFVAGEEAAVGITANGGSLDAYVDWNADGDFADEGEQIADTVAAPTSLDVTAPVGAIAGGTYARFILTGDDNVGEVEDYAVTISAADPGMDYGDAPLSYGEASHDITTLALNSVDAEESTQSGPYADGDDTTGIDDEDGVNLSTFVAGKTANVRVTATEPGYLAAWIDWNGDGNFDDAGEAVADQAVKAGTSVVKITVPVDPYKGLTVARFRLSPDPGTPATGHVTGGEVEDYLVTIAGKPGGGPGKPDSTADEAAALTDDDAVLPPADDGSVPLVEVGSPHRFPMVQHRLRMTQSCRRRMRTRSRRQRTTRIPSRRPTTSPWWLRLGKRSRPCLRRKRSPRSSTGAAEGRGRARVPGLLVRRKDSPPPRCSNGYREGETGALWDWTTGAARPRWSAGSWRRPCAVLASDSPSAGRMAAACGSTRPRCDCMSTSPWTRWRTM